MKKKKTTELKWVEVNGGHLALGHRPKLDDPKAHKAAGATHVVTLLSKREGAGVIGDLVNRAGLEWIWHPMENAKPEGADVDLMEKLVFDIATVLYKGGKVFAHCSAGLHRTGMFAMALLRILNFREPEALIKLREIRELTADRIGDHRIEWSRQFAHCVVCDTDPLGRPCMEHE